MNSLCFCPLQKIVENWYNFLFKCQVELTKEPIWVCCFLFQKVLIINSIALIDKGLVRLSVLSCMTFGRLCCSRNWSFHLGFTFVGIGCLQYCLIIPLMSMGSVVITPFPFLILVIYVISLFFQLAWPVLSVLLIFSKSFCFH